MFGLKAAPMPGMNEAALLDCIEWVALGYEVVQSIFPDWKFAAADTVAANGVHGALVMEHATQSHHARQSGNTNWPPSGSNFIATAN